MPGKNEPPIYSPQSRLISSSRLRLLRNFLPTTVRRQLLSPMSIAIVVLLCLFIFVFSPHLKITDRFGVFSPAPTDEFDAFIPLPDEYFNLLTNSSLPESLFPYPLLARRLHAFLSRPILSHEEAIPSMRENCPLEISDKLVNPDQYNGDGDFWKYEVGKKEVALARISLVKWLESRLDEGEKVVWEEGLGEGRGIVVTGGNQDTTLRLLFLLRRLQAVGSTLPIEVFHYPGEMTDPNQRQEIESLGGVIKEIRGVDKQEGVWKNWQIKGLAVIQSSFQEVLSLDSDNTPLRDLSHLFALPTYTQHGRAAFYPDLSKDHPDNAIWRIIGDTCSLSDWTFETGQFLVDKAGNDGLNLAALWLASGMQKERDFWFRMCGGDKDTFRWAWRALDIEFGRSPKWMAAVGIMQDGRFCGHSVVQHDLLPSTLQSSLSPLDDPATTPTPLFIHSNLLKHLNGFGIPRGSLFTHLKRIRPPHDVYDNPALDYAHSYVYIGNRGMCLDLEWHEAANENPGLREGAEVEIVDLRGVGEETVAEGLEGFEDSFWELGGRIGGW